MKKQDLKALTSQAVDRAVAARAAAGTELTDEQVAAVSGGAGGLTYIKDPSWYGIWEVIKTPIQVQQPGLTQIGVEKLDPAVVAGKAGFEVDHVRRPRSDVPQRPAAPSGRGRIRRRRRSADAPDMVPLIPPLPVTDELLAMAEPDRPARCFALPADASRGAAGIGKPTRSAAGWSRRLLRWRPWWWKSSDLARSGQSVAGGGRRAKLHVCVLKSPPATPPATA